MIAADTVVVTKAGRAAVAKLPPLGAEVHGGAGSWREVTVTPHPYCGPVMILTAGAESITTTPDQAFLTPTGWYAVEDLSPGCVLAGVDVVVTSIVVADVPVVDMYDLQVTNDYAYRAGPFVLYGG